MSKKVTNPGEAISVLIQVAELAQSKGILSFDDAIITKEAIDYLQALAKRQSENQGEGVEGPKSELQAQ